MADNNNDFDERRADNMKKGSAIISLIIAIVVLLTAFVIGHGIKQVRIHRSNSQDKARPQAKVQTQQPGAAALSGGGGPRTEGAPFGQGPDRQDQRPGMNDQQRSDFMAQRPEGFDSGRQRSGGRPQGQGMSEEERQKMRERFENMSEEERAKFREEMRQRSSGGGRRPGGRGAGPGGPGSSPEEGAGPPREGESGASEN